MRSSRHAGYGRVNVLFWITVFLFSILTNIESFAQSSSVGIGTNSPSPRAVLQLVVEDQNGNPQGFLAPVVQTINQRDNIGPTAAEAGMIVYVSETNLFYFWNGSQWIEGLGVFAGSIAGGALTGTYPNPGLGVDVVTNVQLAPASVTNTKIANGAVNSLSIENGSVTSQDIGDNSIASIDILDGTISNNDLGPGSVQTAQIADASIQSQDIGDNQVTLNTLENGGPDQVLTTDPSGEPRYEDRSNFQSSSLPTGNIFIGNGGNVATPHPITGDVSLSVTGDVQLGTDVVTTNELAPNAVTTNEIAAGAVETTDIALSAVNSTIIQDLSIQLNDLGDDQVGLTKIVNAPSGVRNFLVTNAATGEPEYRTQAEVIQGLAGDGLLEDGSGELDVEVDGSTIIIDGITNELGVPDGGIDNDQLALDAVTGDRVLNESLTVADLQGNSPGVFSEPALLVTRRVDINGDGFFTADWENVGPDRVIVTDPVTGEFTSEPRGNFDQLVLAPGEIFIGSASLAPTPTSVGDGNIMIGVGSNITFQSVGGDATLSSSGQLDLNDNQVDGDELATNVAGNGLIYNNTAGINRIELGGALDISTTIVQGSDNMTFDNSGGGNFIVQSTSSSVSIDGNSNLDVDGDLDVGDDVTITGTAVINDNTPSTNSVTGALTVAGGVGVGQNLNIAGITRIENNTNSSSPAGGALQVVGGVGIAADVFIGQSLNTIGNALLNGQVNLGNAPDDNITFGGNISNRSGDDALFFEGQTEDNIQTIFRFDEPTVADNIIVFPDASGTVALTSGVALAPDLALTTDNSGQIVVADDAQDFNVNSDIINIANSTTVGTTTISGGTTIVNSERIDINSTNINIGNGAGDNLDFIGTSTFRQNNFTVATSSPITSLESPETNIIGAQINIGNNASDQVDFTANVDFNNGLDVDAGLVQLADGVNVSIGNGTITTGTGQVSFGGNVDANSGLDVTGAFQAFGDVTLGVGPPSATNVIVNGTTNFNNAVVTFNGGGITISTGGTLQLPTGTSVNRITSSTDGFTPSDNELATTQAIQNIVDGISLDDGSGITVDNANNEIDLGGTLDQPTNIATAGFDLQITGTGQLDVSTNAVFSSADINSGTIDNTIIGGTAAAAATVTDFTATGAVDLGTDAIQANEITANAVGVSEISTAIAGSGLAGGGGVALSVDQTNLDLASIGGSLNATQISVGSVENSEFDNLDGLDQA
ncbi:MAG: hypothetical protein AAF363_02240, partial [Bacteroidota bacterium]